MIASSLIASSGALLATGSPAAAASLPSTINIYMTSDLTGPAAFAGVPTANGVKLAVAQLNKSGKLGKSKINLTIGDSQTMPTVGAQLAASAVGKGYAAVIGDISSNVAVAQAPILARANQTTVFTQAGSQGVLVGPTIFRMTPLQTDQFHLTLEYLKRQGVTSVATVSNSDFPTIVQLNNLVSGQASKYGYKYLGGSQTLTTQSDISGAVSKLGTFNAKASGILLTGPPNASAITQLSQSGYHGIEFGQEGAVDSLGAAGSAANGFVFTADWAYPGTNTTSASFVKAYQSMFNKQAPEFAAEGYDAMNYIAAGLKAAQSTQSKSVSSQLTSIGKKGFNGALGNNLKVIKGQEFALGVLVKWSNGAAVIQKAPGSENP
jgi:branched-chain amino acid transport system substrate-binding protein